MGEIKKTNKQTTGECIQPGDNYCIELYVIYPFQWVILCKGKIQGVWCYRVIPAKFLQLQCYTPLHS